MFILTYRFGAINCREETTYETGDKYISCNGTKAYRKSELNKIINRSGTYTMYSLSDNTDEFVSLILQALEMRKKQYFDKIEDIKKEQERILTNAYDKEFLC